MNKLNGNKNQEKIKVYYKGPKDTNNVTEKSNKLHQNSSGGKAIIKNSILKFTREALNLLKSPTLTINDNSFSTCKSTKTKISVKTLNDTEFQIYFDNNVKKIKNPNNSKMNSKNLNYYNHTASENINKIISKSSSKEKRDNQALGNVNIGINIKNEVFNNNSYKNNLTDLLKNKEKEIISLKLKFIDSCGKIESLTNILDLIYSKLNNKEVVKSLKSSEIEINELNIEDIKTVLFSSKEYLKNNKNSYFSSTSLYDESNSLNKQSDCKIIFDNQTDFNDLSKTNFYKDSQAASTINIFNEQKRNKNSNLNDIYYTQNSCYLNKERSQIKKSITSTSSIERFFKTNSKKNIFQNNLEKIDPVPQDSKFNVSCVSKQNKLKEKIETKDSLETKRTFKNTSNPKFLITNNSNFGSKSKSKHKEVSNKINENYYKTESNSSPNKLFSANNILFSATSKRNNTTNVPFKNNFEIYNKKSKLNEIVRLYSKKHSKISPQKCSDKLLIFLKKNEDSIIKNQNQKKLELGFSNDELKDQFERLGKSTESLLKAFYNLSNRSKVV